MRYSFLVEFNLYRVRVDFFFRFILHSASGFILMDNKEDYNMRCKILILSVISGMLIICACSQNPEEKANKIFVESTNLLNQAKTAEQESYSRALRLYKNAQKNIDMITRKYPGTDLALRITQNDVKFYPDGNEVPLYELKNTIIPALGEKAIAESAPVFLAEYLTDTFQDTLVKIQTYIEIYYLYIEMGQKDHALKTKRKIIYLINNYRPPKHEFSEYYDKIFKFSTYLEHTESDKILESLSPIKENDVLNAKLFFLKGNSKLVFKIFNKSSISFRDKLEIVNFLIKTGAISEAETYLQRMIDDKDWADFNNVNKINILHLMSKTNLKQNCFDLLDERINATNNYNCLIQLAEIYVVLNANENAGNMLQRAIGFLEVDSVSIVSKVKEYFQIMILYDRMENTKAMLSMSQKIKNSYDDAFEESIVVIEQSAQPNGLVTEISKKIKVKNFNVYEYGEYYYYERIQINGKFILSAIGSTDKYLFKKHLLPYQGLSYALLKNFKESLNYLITIEDYVKLSGVLIEYNRLYFSKTKQIKLYCQ